MSKLTKLTPEQIARIPEFRDRYLEYGLSTEPADRVAAEDAIRDAYRAANMKPPAAFIWLSSPAAGALAATMIKFANDEAQVRAQVGDQVGDQVWAQVWAQVRAQVWAQVGDQVWAQVRAQVWAQVRAQVWAQVRAQVGAQVYRCGYGSHDAGWLAFYDFFADACGIKDALRLMPLSRLCAAAGWWWPFENLCIVTDRPSELHQDDANRLHCEIGPAIRYRDGWGVYAWHGTRVPSHWIENRENLDPNEVIKSANVEQRAVGAAIVGWPKMLSVLKSKTIDRHENPDIGELIELTMPGLPEPGRFLKAKCPRNGIIVEGVPRVSDIDGLPIDTALAAQAWRIGDPQSEYIHPPRRT